MCPARFDHCRDLFRGVVSKYQEILKKYSPGARESTDLFEFPDKTELENSRCMILHVHISYVTIEIICYYMVINHLRANHALWLVDDQCKQVWEVVYQHEHLTCITMYPRWQSMSVGMLIPERGEGGNNSRWVHVHYLMGEHSNTWQCRWSQYV